LEVDARTGGLLIDSITMTLLNIAHKEMNVVDIIVPEPGATIFLKKVWYVVAKKNKWIAHGY
jgi:hypothetical protein